MFIPEEEYQKIMKTMPVFCADFLIRCGDKHLLIKRTEEPVKGVYWVMVEDFNIRNLSNNLRKEFIQERLGDTFLISK